MDPPPTTGYRVADVVDARDAGNAPLRALRRPAGTGEAVFVMMDKRAMSSGGR